MIGAGSMGGGMTLLFAEHGLSMSILDPSSETVTQLLQTAKAQGNGLEKNLSKHESYESLCSSLSSPRVFFFSLPHGHAADNVIDGLKPFLVKGDVIVDCSNELWERTERRQGDLVRRGVFYIGCGVSGGYQAARRGPSMCPGGQDQALDVVLPFLEKVAAKGKGGKPCVAKIGQGESIFEHVCDECLVNLGGRWCWPLCEDGSQWDRTVSQSKIHWFQLIWLTLTAV